MSKKLDLIGQRFGSLTALRPAENIRAWICRCDCGKETIVLTDNLRKGNTKSCGCKQYPKMDLTGQRFGRLTALRPAEKIGIQTAWVCRCDCGKEVIVRTNSLRTGHTVSCGCSGGAKNARKGLTFVDGTCVEIIQSKKLQKNNTSGVTGVTWVACKQLWQATICFKGKRHNLGRYRKFEDAVKVRKRAEEDLFENFLQEFASVRIRNDIG